MIRRRSLRRSFAAFVRLAFALPCGWVENARMVEPVSLTLGAIVAGLVAKAAERASERAVEGGEGVLGRLVAALRARFSGVADAPAGEALARVQEVPDSSS